MIQAKNLYFKYEEKYVLKNISLEVKSQSFTAIIGANGSGKTTLAKHFNALLLPTKGSVAVGGLDTKKNAGEVRKKVGFIFQNPEDQLVHSIVEEDAAFGLENLEFSPAVIRNKVKEMLSGADILHLAKANVNTLSAGQKQLVALAGVLAMEPDAIVLDEPTTLLDARNKRNVMGMIKKANQEYKKTIILITNLLDDLKYCSRVIVLKDGGVIFSGKRKELRSSVIKKAGLYD